jgi:hypothetical protein
MGMAPAASRARFAGFPAAWSRLKGLALAALLLLPSAVLAPAQGQEVIIRRATQRTTFTDAEIVEGFFKIAFGAEFSLAGRTDRIRKFDRPVRVYVDNRATPDRTAQVAAVVADIRARVEHLDIAVVREREAANVIVRLVRNRDIRRTIRAIFGKDQARRIEGSLDPQCLAGFAKDDDYRIVRADVILVADAGDFIFYDCAYEEILQALGPINDDPTVPWTMFNDNVRMGFFGIYDQYLLNILYHPRVRPGMSAEAVWALLPDIMPEVRRWVARVNRLPQ